MKRNPSTHNPASIGSKVLDLIYKMFFPALILGTMLLVGGGLSGILWVGQCLIGLVSGAGVVLFCARWRSANWRRQMIPR